MDTREFAEKGKHVWVLVIKGLDMPTSVATYHFQEHLLRQGRGLDMPTSVATYHSWDTMVDEIRNCWNNALPYLRDGHPFGDAEIRQLETQFFLQIGGEQYLVDDCTIG